MLLKRFSSRGHDNMIEHRDCLFNPYAEKRSSYLRKKDLFEPYCEFPVKLPEDKKSFKISEIKFDNEGPKLVKKRKN